MKKLDRKGLSLLWITVFTLLCGTKLFSQDVSGREFWFTIPSNNGGTSSTNSYYFYAISPYCVDSALLEIPQANYKQYFSIQPGQYTQITLPNTVAGMPIFHDRDRQVQGRGIHITAKSPMSLYAVVYSNASVDGEIVLPIEKLGTEYVVTQRSYGGNSPSSATIFATENNTKVTIDTWTTTAGPQSLNVVLNAGQTYMFTRSGFNCNQDHSGAYTNSIDCATLTGSKITADKTIGVVGHANCSNFIACGACDVLMAEFLPVSEWGTEHVTAQVQQRNAPAVTCLAGGTEAEDFSGDILEVVGEIGTTVSMRTTSGIINQVIPAPAYGNYGYGYLFIQNPAVAGREPYSESNMVLTSTKPIQVIQYSRGYQSDAVPTGFPPSVSGNTDPESIVIYPKSMWEDSYLLATLAPPTSPITRAIIVVNDIGTPAPISTIQLNGAALTGTWQAFGTVDANNNWKFIRVSTPLLATSTLRSTAGYKFSFYLTAVGQAESYALQGGQFYDITACTNCPVADIMVPKQSCPNTPVTFKNFSSPKAGDPAPNFYIWDYGDNTKPDTTLTPVDVTHSYDTSGTFDVTMTVVYNGPPVCKETVTYKITIFPKINANAGPDQLTCLGSSVVIGGNPTSSAGTAPLTLVWTPGGSLNDATRPNPTATPSSTQTYTVTVTDGKKCVKTDQVTVTVNPIDSVYLGAGGTICQGDSFQFTVNVATNSASTFEITVSDGSTTRSFTGVTNGFKFWVKPGTTTDYRITAATRGGSTFCVTFDPKNQRVVVKPTPALTISNGGTICKGDNFQFLVTFLQTGTWNYSYTDGTTTTNRNNNTTATNTFQVTPPATTTYTINSVSYTTAPSCAVNPGVQATVVVNNPPNPGIGDSITTCQNGAAINLATLLTNNPDPGGVWSDVNSSGALSGSTFNPVSSQLGTFNITYTVSGNAPCPPQSTNFEIKVVGAPQLANISESCDANLSSYKVTANVSGGDPSTYSSAQGTISLNGGNYIFTSTANYPTKSSYSISVDDANGCGPTTITGTKNCGCKTNAGSMSTTPVEVCETDTARAIHNKDQVFVNGDTLIFYLHEGAGKNLMNVIDSSHVPHFFFHPGMVYGKTYYISSAAGPKLNNSVDQGSDCFNISQGTPVRFYQQVMGQMVGNNVICIGNTSPLVLSFTGIAPFSATITDGSTTTTYAPKNQRDTVVVSPTVTTTYNLVTITDKYCANSNPGSPPSVVTVNKAPQVLPATQTVSCNNTATGYVLTVEVTGGNPATYFAQPSTAGTFSPLPNGNYLFTSATIPNGQNFSVMIDDANGCGPDTLTYSYTCPCITQSGSMSNSLVEACDGNTITIPAPTGQTLDGDDSFQYYVYSNPGNPAGSKLFVQNSNTFNQTGLNLDVIYYVATIYGNDIGGGTVDENDRCFQRSNATPIRFNRLPNANMTGDANICQNQSTPVNFTFSGRAPFTVYYDTLNGSNPTDSLIFGTTSGTSNFSPSQSITYQLSAVKDANGCVNTASDFVTINVNPAPSATMSAGSTVCAGTSVTVTVNFSGKAPFDFTFNYGANQETKTGYNQTSYTKSFSVNANTLCTISNFSDANCPGTSTNTTSFTVNQRPQVATLTSTPEICFGDTVKLYVTFNGSTAPYTATYSQNGVDVTRTFNTTDSVVASYRHGVNNYTFKRLVDSSTPQCVTFNANRSTTSLVDSLPTGTLSGSSTICEGESSAIQVYLTGENPINFNYADDQGGTYVDTRDKGSHDLPQTPASDTIYRYTMGQIVDGNGCRNTGTGFATISVKETPTISFTTTNNTGCPPVTVTVDPMVQAEGNYNCSWNLGNGNTFNGCNQFTEVYSNPGNYSLSYTVTTEFGCTASFSTGNDDVVVQAYPTAEFDFDPAKPTTNDPHVNFMNRSSANAEEFEWTFDSLGTSTAINPSFDFPEDRDGDYTVKLRAATSYGCADSIEKVISVGTDMVVYVPNSFSPNNDGVNDEFKPVVYGMAEMGKNIFDFKVFDRWGNLLFSTTEYGVGWNGRYNGELVKLDSYIWILKVRPKKNAESQTFQGFVNMVH